MKIVEKAQKSKDRYPHYPRHQTRSRTRGAILHQILQSIVWPSVRILMVGTWICTRRAIITIEVILKNTRGCNKPGH